MTHEVEDFNQYPANRMGTRTTILTVLAQIIPLMQASNQISAWDCLNPVGMEKIKRETFCEAEDKEHDRTSYLVAQKALAQEVKGYSCSVQYSEFRFRCGTWSHLKMGAVPKIQLDVETSINWCQTLVQRRKFRTEESSQSFPIQLNRKNIFSVVTTGALIDQGDHIVCKGESRHENNQLLTNLVILKQFTVIVQEEKLKMDSKTVESLNQHEILPCGPRDHGCVTGSRTYIYDVPKSDCDLQYVRTIKTIPYGNYVVDEEQGLILNRTAPTSLPGCRFEITATQFQDIYLVSPSHRDKMESLSAANVELDLDYHMLADYNQYKREKLVQQVKHNNHLWNCQALRDSKPNIPIRIKGDLHILVAGDIIYRFRCPKIKVEIRDSDVCYEDVPIQSEEELFVDLQTKIIKKHSGRTLCSRHFPTVVQTETSWLELPHLKKIKEPKTIPHPDVAVHHEDRSQAGLYTQRELLSWKESIALPQFKSALLTELTQGVCAVSGCTFTGNSPSYDLTNLIPKLEEELNLWKKIKSWIREYGDLMALFVIMYVVVKMLINTTLILFTLMKEGPGAMIALVVTLFISNQREYRRIRRKNQRLNKKSKKIPEAPEAEEFEMDT